MSRKTDYTIELLIGLFLWACLASCTSQYGITNVNPNKKHRDGIERVHKTPYHFDRKPVRRFPMTR